MANPRETERPEENVIHTVSDQVFPALAAAENGVQRSGDADDGLLYPGELLGSSPSAIDDFPRG